MVGAPFQASLLDTDLLDTDLSYTGPRGVKHVTRVGPVSAGLRRHRLAGGAWVDVRRRWVAGADPLFERLRAEVPWRAERRPMYDRTVVVPRLLSFYDRGQPLPDPALETARRALDEHYALELGEPFATVGLAFYRDGRDSVAWHGDRTGRGATHDTMVAILVLGAPRALLLRPRPGGPADRRRRMPSGHSMPAAVPAGHAATTIRHELGHGDLLVMGGSCQRTWEHAVPKTARSVGPRISVQFRPRDVR
ncbi:alpha-ketoglutarate-dependent dioxygenase AlkB [Frankia sp. CNm7]|uniref:Alpha-ketoglutarate-dependent dioxygenase AlkB n=1 Tax=Frankia nepalensis TaxID=1836974 RepID=A0A937RNY6_9ACTN|nr:alpha-ketoglutarate-dependent dioxygenase AlkB [Frankia nepalensis]MBL7499507.1 alpha-ketoglutarate-dependent dioxygenase AlkB [Frankia nepalensis]MBL7514896.1 alpha-ketoglutarate-dependent dioxygenase AlkB [Frankia nepalensis]MBL7524940.1 alpha-ketoglutarate-dependent dioxygenase AlkB [Frankia nepalensis]MBL7633650.1 alpha-ketoglutarate-dependent dioxygenase AlkB [Frankia nepalensis]